MEKIKVPKKKSKLALILFIAGGIITAVVLVILYRMYIPYSDLALALKKKDMSELVSEEEYIREHPEIVTTTSDGTEIISGDFKPVKFEFIDRGIECDLRPVKMGADRYMETIPSAHDAAWLDDKPYAVPGEVGRAVIAGHNLWRGEQGSFSLLRKMEVGEKVGVTFDIGFTRYFEVTEIKRGLEYNDKSIMRTEGLTEPVLTLVTCEGDWDSNIGSSRHRIVVVCKPIG